MLDTHLRQGERNLLLARPRPAAIPQARPWPGRRSACGSWRLDTVSSWSNTRVTGWVRTPIVCARYWPRRSASSVTGTVGNMPSGSTRLSAATIAVHKNTGSSWILSHETQAMLGPSPLGPLGEQRRLPVAGRCHHRDHRLLRREQPANECGTQHRFMSRRVRGATLRTYVDRCRSRWVASVSARPRGTRFLVHRFDATRPLTRRAMPSRAFLERGGCGLGGRPVEKPWALRSAAEITGKVVIVAAGGRRPGS